MTTKTDTHPKLGAYVMDNAGRRGRVVAIYHGCNQSAQWLAEQQLLTAEQRTAPGVWLDILVHDSGSIHTPASMVKVIPPFEFKHSWDSFYFDVEAS
jgi:hypothetical protein